MIRVEMAVLTLAPGRLVVSCFNGHPEISLAGTLTD